MRSKRSRSKFRLIRLGTDRQGRPVFMAESGSYGVTVIIARPRYGKSILLRNIYTQIAEGRRIILIDYIGEHDQSKFGNFRAETTSFIPDLYTVRNFAFYISDFNTVNDWTSMGISQRGAPLIAELIKYTQIHQNDPVRFLELLRMLPSRDEEIEKFNETFGEFGLRFASRVNDAIKQSIVLSFENAFLSGLLMPPVGSENYEKYTPGKIYVNDWIELTKRHVHLNIDLQLTTSESVTLARSAIGKILEKLTPALDILKPTIIVEEADFVAPSTDIETITSLNQLRKYVLKHQRKGVSLIFVTQDPGLLSNYILLSGVTWILGPHSFNATVSSLLNEPHLDYLTGVIHQLKSDKYKNEREFAIMNSGDNGRYKIFRPDTSITRIPR